MNAIIEKENIPETEYNSLIKEMRAEICPPTERKINIVGYPLKFEWGRPRERFCLGYGEPPTRLIIFNKKTEEFISFSETEKERIVELIKASNDRQDEYEHIVMSWYKKNN